MVVVRIAGAANVSATKKDHQVHHNPNPPNRTNQNRNQNQPPHPTLKVPPASFPPFKSARNPSSMASRKRHYKKCAGLKVYYPQDLKPL
mmetsp:Transcript_12292/g.22337  ORF Transcript_12292/g.22337 Transcript_12292/m.22337 type:complete len:89 (-) Transcript_12292:124-390(-)